MKHRRFTFQEHVATGIRLKMLREDLIALHLNLSSAYPDKVHDRAIRRAMASLSVLRSRLENEMFKEHPVEGNTHVYYGLEAQLILDANDPRVKVNIPGLAASIELLAAQLASYSQTLVALANQPDTAAVTLDYIYEQLIRIYAAMWVLAEPLVEPLPDGE